MLKGTDIPDVYWECSLPTFWIKIIILVPAYFIQTVQNIYTLQKYFLKCLSGTTSVIVLVLNVLFKNRTQRVVLLCSKFSSI